jgi:hypothetical protein
MLLSTVSRWDKTTMELLARLHGIPVRESCIRHGFDWRSRELNPEIAQMYGKVHVKDKDAFLARESMLTYYRAGRIRHDEEIPTKQSGRDNIQKILHRDICDSLQTDPNHPSLFLMSPEHIRTSNSILQRLRQVADAQIQESEVPIPQHESVNLRLVNSDPAAPRPQRRAAAECVQRNAELSRQMQGQAEEESQIYSSEEEGCRDWGADGDKPSDDED